jgi:hypothetical protein
MFQGSCSEPWDVVGSLTRVIARQFYLRLPTAPRPPLQVIHNHPPAVEFLGAVRAIYNIYGSRHQPRIRFWAPTCDTMCRRVLDRSLWRIWCRPVGGRAAVPRLPSTLLRGAPPYCLEYSSRLDNHGFLRTCSGLRLAWVRCNPAYRVSALETSSFVLRCPPMRWIVEKLSPDIA